MPRVRVMPRARVMPLIALFILFQVCALQLHEVGLALGLGLGTGLE